MTVTPCSLPEQRKTAKALQYVHGQFALKRRVYRHLYDGLHCAV